MANILVECPQKIASVRVGVLMPLQPLVEAGLCCIHYKDTRDITTADIVWSDVVICVRGCEYPTLRVVQAAKAAGRFCIYFLDDDLLHIPDGIESTNYYRDQKIKVNLLKILGLCDVLWAVNKKILEQYGEIAARTVLLRVPASVLREPPKQDKVLHFLYAGSVDHSHLVQELLSTPIQNILKDSNGSADFTFIGADPGAHLRKAEGVKYYPFFEDYNAYQKAVLAGGYSVGLAPIYDTHFYACKYYNKFIEYSSYGLMGIYSDYEPYKQIVLQDKTGLLCENTPVAWQKAMQKAIDNPEAIVSIARNAAKVLKDRFDGMAIAEDLKRQLPELIRFRAPSKKVYLPPMRMVFYQERLLLLCRMYKWKALWVIPKKMLQKIWKVIRTRNV